MTAWSIVPEGLRLALRVTPKARRAAFGAVTTWPDGDRLEVAVLAPPEDGKANAAVVALLAERLGMARSAISMLQGTTGRQKLVLLRGDGIALAARLAEILSVSTRDRRR